MRCFLAVYVSIEKERGEQAEERGGDQERHGMAMAPRRRTRRTLSQRARVIIVSERGRQVRAVVCLFVIALLLK